jgi:hypothetical protein
VWGSLLLPALSEMSKIIYFGLSQASMVPIPIVIEAFYGMSWPDCFVGGTCYGALRRDFNITRSPSERSGVGCFCPTMVEF